MNVIMQWLTMEKLNHRRFSLAIAVRFLSLGILLHLLTGCSANDDMSAKQAPAVEVVTAQVEEGEAPYYLDAIGFVQAFSVVDIKSRVTGQILDKSFHEGGTVTTGQTLFTIDPAFFQARLDEASAHLRQSKALVEQAQRDFDRYKGLFSDKAVSPEQYEMKKLDLGTKQARVAVDEAALEIARLNLEYCTLRSPLNGKTGKLKVDVGNIVIADQDILVTVKEMKPIKVKFSLPSKFLGQIRQYDSDAQLEVEAWTSGCSKPQVGRLTLIDNGISPKTGMLMLEGTFPNDDICLWPGDFANVRLKLTVTKNAVLIPSAAASQGAGGKYAWVVKRDQTVEIRSVTISRSVDGREVIAEGLSPGETVVTQGELTLYPGAKVVLGTRTQALDNKSPYQYKPELQ